MKLLVFAHVPPPHHGQSYMVELMLQGFAARARCANASEAASAAPIECWHVDARYSRDTEDIGGLRVNKALALLGYCGQAVWLRLRHGVNALYFVPAPPRTVPVVRDIVTLTLLRPFFARLILHWHAAGLGQWLREQPAWLRLLAQHALGHADLSIVLAPSSEHDAHLLAPKRVAVVQHGIPDPWPDFSTRLGPLRQARAGNHTSAIQRKGPGTTRVRVLFIALCTREKGLFDAIEAVGIANRQLATNASDLRFELHVAGGFRDATERAELDAAVSAPEWNDLYRYHGFVSGEQKTTLFEQADILLFPTYYEAESFPVVVLEAMAAGLAIVATHWRAIPEMLPADYPGLTPPREPELASAALMALVGSDTGLRLRAHFLEHFSLEHHLRTLENAVRSVCAG